MIRRDARLKKKTALQQLQLIRPETNISCRYQADKVDHEVLVF